MTSASNGKSLKLFPTKRWIYTRLF